jgi:hypothetical protein
MKIGVLFVAMFALLFTACPAGSAPKTAQKKTAVERSFRAFNLFNSTSLLSNRPRLQAEPTTEPCPSGGTITFSSTSTETSATITITANACKDGTTTISTGASGFTLTASSTGDATSGTFSFTLGFNGKLTIVSPEGNSDTTYSNFTFAINYANSVYTITVNGSVTDAEGTYTFNNETYTEADFGAS